MKLLDFDSFINESLNEKISNKVFLNDIADSDYTEVEVSLRYAREVGELFNNSFKRYGKQTSSNVFKFDKTEDVVDFIDIIINKLDIPNDELELS